MALRDLTDDAMLYTELLGIAPCCDAPQTRGRNSHRNRTAGGRGGNDRSVQSLVLPRENLVAAQVATRLAHTGEKPRYKLLVRSLRFLRDGEEHSRSA